MSKPLRPSALAILSWVFVGQLAYATEFEAHERPVSFELDVQPILTSTGCNAGACHGKQRGQNGFQLSLLGFDSDFDYQALVLQARGRRVVQASPVSSLLLQKATAATPHGGGKRIEIGSEEHGTLLRWIELGAPRRVAGEPKLVNVQLDRNELSLMSENNHRLQVRASYSDGTSRDVTRLTTFLSNDAGTVSVSSGGVLTAGKLPGETAIMARYMNRIEVCNVMIPRPQEVPASFYAALPRNNFIDELVWRKLEKLAIRPSMAIDDSTFMRRAFTDIIGRLPRIDEVREFHKDASADKRRRLVDHLLERPEYVDHWANQWADLLRPNPYRVGIKAVLNYDNWIRQQLRDNIPYHEFVRKLVTAKGSTWTNGAATLYRDRRSPDETTVMISQLFLGVRLECAKCHHHPFERWSQDDFYKFAAFFAKVNRKGTGLSPPISGGEETVLTSSSGEVRHPATDEVLPPMPLFGNLPLDDSDTTDDPREDLARWMASPENDLLAKAQANRLWAAFMGRGIVDPVDDLRSTNPPSNDELLTALANDFRESGYDQKHLMRLICNSYVYGLSSIPNESNISDRSNYSRHYRNRLRAEILSDAIADITGIPVRFDGMPPESRASQIWTYRSDSIFLDTFGRPNENQDPPCERTPDATVSQTLHLMNGLEIDRQIRSDESLAAKLAASDLSNAEIIEDLYLTVYSRFPTSDEQEVAEKVLASERKIRRARIEDLLWAMLNSPEFMIQN